ncbi:DUF1772 domain-containing protein [Aquamicrobium sp. LC103]|uniref:DUF1772 domain-containing protein n=1 Tax=Aquamicrobium sp. LC103 TaxID=1120658 RepID=UPI00063E958B|nr:DUF1772 domain-containing protein [Aquamicrobium sp. LC103]TKT78191.1 DUF1772 domain-containing protein [Aquamicrobium sp. LC103]
MQKPATIILWLFVIFLGISVGAGLYEARIMVPIWRDTPPETWLNTGIAFWAFVTTGPLTLLVLAGLYFSWRSVGPVRPWWLAALVVSVMERIATFAYFIPTMVWLQGQTGDAGAVVASTLETWTLLNHGRHVLSILAWLLALKALSLIGPAHTKPLQA